jgi:hypothetical protein
VVVPSGRAVVAGEWAGASERPLVGTKERDEPC